MIEVSPQTHAEMAKHVGHHLTIVQDSLGFPTLVCRDCTTCLVVFPGHVQMYVIAEFFSKS